MAARSIGPTWNGMALKVTALRAAGLSFALSRLLARLECVRRRVAAQHLAQHHQVLPLVGHDLRGSPQQGRIAQRSERQGFVISVIELDVSASEGDLAVRARTTVMAPAGAA